MWIVDQWRNTVVCLDRYLGLVNGKDGIYAKYDRTYDGILKKVCLGVYPEERKNEVFAEMLDKLFPKETMILQNVEVSPDVEQVFEENSITGIFVETPDESVKIERILPRVYYMPEK